MFKRLNFLASSYPQIQRHLLMGFAVTLLTIFTPLSQIANAQSTNTPWQKQTQSQLTEVWWKWLYSIPASKSPVLDETGVNAFNGQPYSDLLFLAGTYTLQVVAGDVIGEATRNIEVKEGIALFFPLINGEWDNLCLRPTLGGNCFGVEKFPDVLSVAKLKALASDSIDVAENLHAKLTKPDGSTVDIPNVRLQTVPFSYKLPASDNLYQAQGIDIKGVVSPAVGDGYFAFVPGILTPGNYTLTFGGQAPIDPEGHLFKLDITYHITVTL